MKSISSALAIEKNKIASSNAWLVLLDITLPSTQQLYLVNNNEPVAFQSRTYAAVPFELDPPKESSKGELSSVTLKISNVTRFLQAYLESTDGALGTSIIIRVVNSGLLAEDYSDLEMTFSVMAVAANAQWVTFSLGTPSPLRKRFPLHRYIAGHCNWRYKSAECAYGGALPACNRTLADCRTHGNSARFGGYPGLQGGGLSFA